MAMTLDVELAAKAAPPLQERGSSSKTWGVRRLQEYRRAGLQGQPVLGGRVVEQPWLERSSASWKLGCRLSSATARPPSARGCRQTTRLDQHSVLVDVRKVRKPLSVLRLSSVRAAVALVICAQEHARHEAQDW